MGIKERKEREKAKRRESIIDAAEQIIFTKGYTDSSMSDIADMAELAKGTLYTYFKNKDELYFAVGDRAKKLLIDKFHNSTIGLSNGHEKMIALANAYFDFFKEQKPYFDAVIYREMAPVDMTFFIDNTEEFCSTDMIFNEPTPIGVIIDTLTEGVKDGSINSTIDPMTTAFSLWSQATGVINLVSQRGFFFQHAFGFEEKALWNNFINFLKIVLK